MANEFKVKNGIKFPDNTIQTTAASAQPIIQLQVRTNLTAAVTTLTQDGAAVSSTNQLEIGADERAVAFHGIISAIDRAGNVPLNAAAWEIKGLITRETGVANTTLRTFNINTIARTGSLSSNWAVSIAADTTNGALSVRGQGNIDCDVRWRATITYTSLN